MLHTYITKPDSIYICSGFEQSSVQNHIVLYTLCHAIHFLMAISFSVLANPIQHVSVKLLELHHDNADKTVPLNAHEYFLGQHVYKLKTKKTSV